MKFPFSYLASFLLVVDLLLTSVIFGQKVYQVSVQGNDKNAGTASSPLRTISAGARLAMPGDTVLVHQGTYRELISPQRGGEAANKRIVYQAAPGEQVEIKGSEVISNWSPVQDGVWKVKIPDSYFGNYNPYTDVIYGDWFFPPPGMAPHTGEVYLNGKNLFEVHTLEKVIESEKITAPSGVSSEDRLPTDYTWYCHHKDSLTIIYANFHDHDPNKELVEINVRPSCFYPLRTGVNYISVKGFRMSQAATQWAAPTAEQVGIIGTNWSKGWIIEDNIISDSKCVGITLGKDRASGQNVWSANPGKDGSDLYNEMVIKVIAEGWNKEHVGSHIVRRNTIFNCSEAGICGSFGAAYSEVTGNHIYNIYTNRGWNGAEMAGIKIHGAIDVLIEGNQVHNAHVGLWLDWMAQGARVSRNIFYDNDYVDFYPEVDHGPYLVDNNLLLSPWSIQDCSEGGAYAHNLVAGVVSRKPQSRVTPYFMPHTTKLAAVKDIQGGDNRFFNNIFVGNTRMKLPDSTEDQLGYGLSLFDHAALPVRADGNIYLSGASKFRDETNAILIEDIQPVIAVSQGANGRVNLSVNMPKWPSDHKNKLVTTSLLGEAIIPGEKYESPDGAPLKINVDYFGNKRNEKNPMAGPFERLITGEQSFEVW